MRGIAAQTPSRASLGLLDRRARMRRAPASPVRHAAGSWIISNAGDLIYIYSIEPLQEAVFCAANRLPPDTAAAVASSIRSPGRRGAGESRASPRLASVRASDSDGRRRTVNFVLRFVAIEDVRII